MPDFFFGSDMMKIVYHLLKKCAIIGAIAPPGEGDDLLIFDGGQVFTLVNTIHICARSSVG